MAGLPAAFHRFKALLAVAVALAVVIGFAVLDLGLGRGAFPRWRALGAGLVLGALGNLAAFRIALCAFRRNMSAVAARRLYTVFGFSFLVLGVAIGGTAALGHWVTGLSAAEHREVAGTIALRVALGYLAASFLVEATRAWRRRGGPPLRRAP